MYITLTIYIITSHDVLYVLLLQHYFLSYYVFRKMEHDTYEKDVISIEETLAIQQEKLDELSKLSTDVHDRNTLLEGEVHELRKRLNTAKSQLKVRMQYDNKCDMCNILS